MAAATTNGGNYTANDANQMPRGAPAGAFVPTFNETLATTRLDDVGDRTNLVEIEAGRTIKAIYIENDDLDSNGAPTLDADIVIAEGGATELAAGTETILVNAGTLFQAASTGRWFFVNHKVKDTVRGHGTVRFKVNAAAATAAEGAIKGLLLCE